MPWRRRPGALPGGGGHGTCHDSPDGGGTGLCGGGSGGSGSGSGSSSGGSSGSSSGSGGSSGGGRDCFYQGLGNEGTPTTTATGTACCVTGSDGAGFICSCYDDASYCQGYSLVSECTSDSVPPCSSDVTVGYKQVAKCQ